MFVFGDAMCFLHSSCVCVVLFIALDLQTSKIKKFRKGACTNCGAMTHKKSECVERPRRRGAKITGNNKVQLNIQEIKQPELDAALIAQGIADQLAGRVAFRRAMKRAMQSAMRLGAEGIKIRIAGRLSGAEMARTEMQTAGRVPLTTLDADISYALCEAKTTFGVIGVKVWINRGRPETTAGPAR